MLKQKQSNEANVDFKSVSNWNIEHYKIILRKHGSPLRDTSAELKNRCIVLQTLFDIKPEGKIPLNIDDYRNHYNTGNTEETNKVDMIEKLLNA